MASRYRLGQEGERARKGKEKEVRITRKRKKFDKRTADPSRPFQRSLGVVFQ